MENKTETVAQKALRLLSEIPHEQFIYNVFSNNKDKCCAIGHFTRLTSDNPDNFSMENCSDKGFVNYYRDNNLRKASKDYLKDKHECDSSQDLAEVNNTLNVNGYREVLIKDRVIHLLKDMVEAGY